MSTPVEFQHIISLQTLEKEVVYKWGRVHIDTAVPPSSWSGREDNLYLRLHRPWTHCIRAAELIVCSVSQNNCTHPLSISSCCFHPDCNIWI